MLTFIFSLSFSGPPSKENACRLLTKENIMLNAIKMLEMNLKIIGNDIKAEINEEWDYSAKEQDLTGVCL